MEGFRRSYTAADLQACVEQLPQRDREFAMSLVNGVTSRGRASDKQSYWIDQLCQRAKGDKPAVAVVVPPEAILLEGLIARLPERDHGFARDLVTACKNGQATPGRMKWVHTLVERAQQMNQKSERRDAIQRIADKTGLAFKTVRRVLRRLEDQFSDKTDAELVAALETDKEGLAKIAKQYGDATHSCCFCGLGLTDERSTSAGYGPICAGKYNLPWGE